MRLEQLVPFVRGRWRIEQFYEEEKQECGLDDYQGRRWDGLHRHLALVMLAYSFLAVQALPTAPADPAATPVAGAFPPGTPAQSTRRPSAGAGRPLQGSRPLADRHQPNAPLPSA